MRAGLDIDVVAFFNAHIWNFNDLVFDSADLVESWWGEYEIVLVGGQYKPEVGTSVLCAGTMAGTCRNDGTCSRLACSQVAGELVAVLPVSSIGCPWADQSTGCSSGSPGLDR
jgi:hypothetical protein